MAVDNARDPAGEIAALAPGTVFHGVYEVVRCIKAGGMGAVYEVLQTSTQRYRALKVMLPSLVTDPEMRARFELEAKIAAGIESEHIVETMDAGIDQPTGMPFIVMELLKGEELGALLKERKRLSPDDVVTYLSQAALALDRTHAAGIIHRDLKPENLFLTRRDDGSPRVKILDFGVAKIVADGSVNANSTKTVGSPLYMGPEQISGEQKIGPAVDRYSLAHIAFTLLVGKAYWHVERKAAEGIYPFMMQLVKGAQVTGSVRAAAYGVRLPEAFDPWFVKATSIDASQRHDSAGAMVAELAQVFGIAAQAGSLTPLPRAPLPPAPVSLPSPASLAPTLVKSSSDDSANVSPSGQTTQKDAVSVMVRSDEPSLQPVSVDKPTRAWVVPVSLLVIGIVGIAGAFLLWPVEKTPTPVGSSESVRMPTQAAPSAALVVPTIVASSAPIEAAPTASSITSLVVASTAKSAAPVASTATSAVPRASSTASSKPIRPKGNDVLDQY
jgi:serine/threonine protein kinase